MSDMAVHFQSARARSIAKRAMNREQSAQILERAGVNFGKRNGGAHLIVMHEGKTVDFWPGTGKSATNPRPRSERRQALRRAARICRATWYRTHGRNMRDLSLGETMRPICEVRSPLAAGQKHPWRGYRYSAPLAGLQEVGEDVKAISLWQPYATAIAIGIKQIETRGWFTHYRGALVIHAAKRWSREQREFAAVERTLGRLPGRVPLGAIVATAKLVECWPTDQMAVSAIERLYGNFTPGRFAWVLREVRALPEPIPYTGRQGFFEVPDELLEVDVA